jgi:ATP-binding cassette subfamily F protein 3
MSENLLQLQSACKSYGTKLLFDQAGFSVNADEHIGVIGPNGAGKTTLFRILLGEENLDAGEISRSRKLSVGYLSQHDQWQPQESGEQYLQRVSRLPLWELKARGRILQLTEGLLARPVASLSGGFRMRVKLLGLLGQEPNLMLLDEPTNYLDLETTLILERFLQGFAGAFLLISHDREFLRRTTDHILEIEAGEMTKFNGNIDDYFEQKSLLRAQLEARAASQAEKRKEILDFVARFGASATKARQAQSRLKALARMEAIEVKFIPVASTIRIPVPEKTGKLTLALEQARFGYGEKAVLSDVSLQVLRGDHVAVVGMNGAGKSTLLKGLAGTLAPLAGKFAQGHGVRNAFFAQHVIEALDPEDTVYRSLEKAAGAQVLPQEILDLAGSLLFSGDDTQKPVHVLSGGEKSRVALGRVLLQRAPCLILDEPTNHLDFQTVEALTEALRSYPGTVIVVSHDRGFVKRVGTKILEVKGGQVRLYPGTYEEYVWSLQQEISEEQAGPKPAKPEGAGLAEKPENWKDTKKKLDRDLRACEKKIAACEREMGRLQEEERALNRKISESASPSMEEIQALAGHSQKLRELEEEWVLWSEKKEELQAAIGGMKS